MTTEAFWTMWLPWLGNTDEHHSLETDMTGKGKHLPFKKKFEVETDTISACILKSLRDYSCIQIRLTTPPGQIIYSLLVPLSCPN